MPPDFQITTGNVPIPSRAFPLENETIWFRLVVVDEWDWRVTLLWFSPLCSNLDNKIERLIFWRFWQYIYVYVYIIKLRNYNT